MINKQDLLKLYQTDEEEIFYNKIVSKFDIEDWIVPYKKDMKYFMENIYQTSAEKFESPDLKIKKNNNVVCFIEDIKVDGTIHFKPLTKTKRSKNDMEYEEYLKLVEIEKTKEEFSVSQEFTNEFSLSTYIDRFKYLFDKHYVKLEKRYESRVKNDGHLVDIGFLIKNTFYNAVLFDENKIFSAINLTELIQFIKKRKKVKFIILYTQNNVKPQAIFFRNRNKTIRYINKRIDKVNELTTFIVPGTKHVNVGLNVALSMDDFIKIDKI